MCVCVCVYAYIYTYIYIYRERERQRENIIDLTVKSNTTKLLEENICRTLFDANSSNISFELFLKAIETKAKQMETN